MDQYPDPNPCRKCRSKNTVYSAPVNDAPEDDETLNGWHIICKDCGLSEEIEEPISGANNLYVHGFPVSPGLTPDPIPEGAFQEMLPPHKCSLTITHNQHKDYYEDIGKYIISQKMGWASDEQKALAISTNEIWEMQWYPETPIGFHRIAAPTLDALIEFGKILTTNREKKR